GIGDRVEPSGRGAAEAAGGRASARRGGPADGQVRADRPPPGQGHLRSARAGDIHPGRGLGGATGTGLRPSVVAAVDLGASGGRVIAGRVSGSGVELHEVGRFPNEPVLTGGTLHWDILGLYRSVCAGLSAAAATFPLASVGIDTWGVDYGLLDATGGLIGNPVHYRDSRTDGVTVPVPAETLYAVAGIQHLPINTIYQLAAAARTPALSAAETLLLIPDLLAYWLTGAARAGAAGLIERAGIPVGIFPPLRQPGDPIGPITAGQTRVGSGDGAGRPSALAVGNSEPVPLIAV